MKLGLQHLWVLQLEVNSRIPLTRRIYLKNLPFKWECSSRSNAPEEDEGEKEKDTSFSRQIVWLWQSVIESPVTLASTKLCRYYFPSLHFFGTSIFLLFCPEMPTYLLLFSDGNNNALISANFLKELSLILCLVAIHSRTIAWKIPWTEEPGRLQSMGSQRVGRDWATSLSLSLCLYISSLTINLKPILDTLFWNVIKLVFTS